MKCNQSRPRFELESPCPFPTTITITPWAPPKTRFIAHYLMYPKRRRLMELRYFGSIFRNLLPTESSFNWPDVTFKHWEKLDKYSHIISLYQQRERARIRIHTDAKYSTRFFFMWVVATKYLISSLFVTESVNKWLALYAMGRYCCVHESLSIRLLFVHKSVLRGKPEYK